MKFLGIVALIFLLLSLVAAQSNPNPPTKETATKISDKELRAKILNDEVKPLLDPAASVDWVAVEKQLAGKHGAAIARQVIASAKTVENLRRRDWPNVHKSMSAYIKEYGTEDLTARTLNLYAWRLFENLSDNDALKEAAEWSRKSTELDKDEMAFCDTYANILHRLGRTKEATELQEKVVSLESDEDMKELYQITLNKMKKGEPTWPVK